MQKQKRKCNLVDDLKWEEGWRSMSLQSHMSSTLLWQCLLCSGMTLLTQVPSSGNFMYNSWKY